MSGFGCLASGPDVSHYRAADPVPAQFRYRVSNALVAVDAGEAALLQHEVVHVGGAVVLLGEIEIALVVTVPAGQGVIGAEARPFALSHGQTVCLEFLPRIDPTNKRPPDVFGGFDLTYDLVGPFVGNVAVRTSGAHKAAGQARIAEVVPNPALSGGDCDVRIADCTTKPCNVRLWL